MSKDLLVIVPSRGRPHKAKELIQAWRDTHSYSAHLLFVLDDDDPTLDEYLELEDQASGIFMDMRPRMRLVGSLNAAAVDNAPGYKYLAFWGDDVRPRTVDWDVPTCEALRQSGPASFVFWDDLFPGNRGRLPCNCAMTSDVATALGYMAPPALIHMHADSSWKTWGEALSRLMYLPDVVVEHLHYAIGKSEIDDTYRQSEATYGPDQIAWEHYLRTDLQSDLQKLREISTLGDVL